MLDLEAGAKDRGIKYFLISFTDLFGIPARQAGAGGGDQGDVRGWRGVRRLRHLARHDARPIPTSSPNPIPTA